MKKIKITEQDLHNIIKESVNAILNEMYDDKPFLPQGYDDEWNDEVKNAEGLGLQASYDYRKGRISRDEWEDIIGDTNKSMRAQRMLGNINQDPDENYKFYDKERDFQDAEFFNKYGGFLSPEELEYPTDLERNSYKYADDENLNVLDNSFVPFRRKENHKQVDPNRRKAMCDPLPHIKDNQERIENFKGTRSSLTK